jgi:hypothetical protein
MRTSLNEIRDAEKYLFKQLNTEDSLLFEAKMVINPLLRLNVSIQKKVYSLLKMYHRKKLREEFEIIHDKLFNHPDKRAFQESVHQLFKR